MFLMASQMQLEFFDTNVMLFRSCSGVGPSENGAWNERNYMRLHFVELYFEGLMVGVGLYCRVWIALWVWIYVLLQLWLTVMPFTCLEVYTLSLIHILLLDTISWDSSEFFFVIALSSSAGKKILSFYGYTHTDAQTLYLCYNWMWKYICGNIWAF